MKYSIEISDGGVIEKFVFRDKEYTKTWRETLGGLETKDKGFDEQIEADGYYDAWALGAIYDRIEQEFDVLEFWELYLRIC